MGTDSSEGVLQNTMQPVSVCRGKKQSKLESQKGGLMKKTLMSVITLVSLLMMSVPSPATIKAGSTRTEDDVFTDGDTHVIPLNNFGATSINFTTSAPNQKVVIS